MSEQERFHQLADRYFEASYQAMPVMATILGIHTYDHLLGDFSAAGFARYLAQVKEYANRLKEINAEQLSDYEATDCALLEADMRSNVIWLEKIADWRRNPNFYPQWPLYGIFMLISRRFAPLEERLKSVTGRLRLVPEALAEGMANVENPPKVFTEVAIQTTEGGLQFCQGLIPQVAAQAPDLEKEVLEANEAALAAFRNYLHYLKDDLLPRSKGDFAIGADLFEEKLRVEHMLDYSAEELLSLGREVFEETKVELEKVAAEINPGKPWPAIIEEARNDYPSGDRLLEVYREELNRLKSFIVEHDLVTIPANEELEVIETPLFERSTTPYAAYMAPAPFEEEQKGQFWVTPLDTTASPEAQVEQLREHCFHSFPLTAVHEAYPGHHLQLVFSNNVSSKIRKHSHSTLFAEGWALYCEQLMNETGYYTDPRMRLFQLKDQLWRAARIIIDVGLHHKTMSLEEAVRLLVDEVYLSQAAAIAEVRRYTMSPTQPLSYMVGKLEVLKLRDQFKGLSLRQFHDTLLSSGTIPFKLVREEMQTKIKGGSP